MSDPCKIIQRLLIDRKLDEAYIQLKQLEETQYDDISIRNNIVALYMRYFWLCKKHENIIQYSKKYDKKLKLTVISYENIFKYQASAYMQLKQYDQARDVLNEGLKEITTSSGRTILYGYLGLLYNEMKKYYLAIDNIQLGLKLNEEDDKYWLLENLAFSQLQLGKYEDALNNINQVIEAEGKSIFNLIVKSEALIQLGRIEESVETLGLAKDIVVTKSYDKTLLLDSEIEWIEKKFSKENISLIDEILSAEKKTNQIKNPEALKKFNKCISSVVLQFTNKEKLDIDELVRKKVMEDIKANFSQSTLDTEKAKIQLEEFEKTKQIQEYNDAFLQQATLIFMKSQIIMNGGKIEESLDLRDLISLIPFFGSSLSSVYSTLQYGKNFYDDEKIKINSQAICEFGKTIGQYENLMQQITAKILSDQNYSKQILESQEELLSGYRKLIKNAEDYVYQKKKQILKVELLEQTPARILGTKDAQELIGGLIVKGLLTQYQKDESVANAAMFVCSDDNKRKLLIELAEVKIKNNNNNSSSSNKKGGCGCNIF